MKGNEEMTSHFMQEVARFSDPYQVIAKFFDTYSLASVRERIARWVETVSQKERWQERHPSNLEFFYKKLSGLVFAVHQIRRKRKTGKTAIILLTEKGYDAESNLLHPALYFGWGARESVWDHFPRSLSLEEYNDPYLVFLPFFSLHSPEGWQGVLHELYADVSKRKRPARDRPRERDLLPIQKHLLKLAEAVHLIDVREVTHIGDFKKRKPFTLARPCGDLSITSVLKVNTCGLVEPAPSKDEVHAAHHRQC